MPEARQQIVRVLVQSAIAEWITTLGLIFGGCCSNAWALELATSQNPHAGSLITFAQFLLVSLYGLRKHLTLAPVYTGRKELLRLTASNILNLRSKKHVAEQVYVAVEGPSSAAELFTEELAHEIKFSPYDLSLKRFTYAGDALDISSRLDTLWGPDVLDDSDTVVLVDGHHLHTPDLRGRWDYSIFLVSSEKSSRENSSPDLIDSSLTVDVTTSTHPVIVSPLSTRLPPWNMLNTIPRIRLKKRSIPISRWAIQVALFLLTSLLNNAAFGYNVPMAVHIIFRSGGLVVNMIMGWLIDGRRYNATQIVSVVVVTLGVACTTLSASQPSSNRVSTSTTSSPGSYFVGILTLTLALVMSGFMGLAQDRTYAQYGREHWQEAMFYLHFLALPGFAFVWRDLGSQVRTVNASARIEVGLETFAMPLQTLVKAANMDVTSPSGMGMPYATILQYLPKRRLSIPSFYFPLLLNVGTQLLCVSGVHRLTSRVNSLTVTLVLVVRKAVSLGISVVLLRKGRGGGLWLWIGAALVLAGTVGYTVGGSQKKTEGAKGLDPKKEN